MVKQIFVNLPIKDLEKTKEFWTSLGFSFNLQFTDEKAGALVLGENIFAMLITEPFYKTFIAQKEISDSFKTSEVINAIAVETKEEVDELVEKALKAGATTYRGTDDYGWMYNRNFQDIDGHLWEVVYLDLSKLPKDLSGDK